MQPLDELVSHPGPPRFPQGVRTRLPGAREAAATALGHQKGGTEAAIDAGAHIINDVSGGLADPAMHALIARAGVVYVCQHWRGDPETMDRLTDYPGGVVAGVEAELRERLDELPLVVGKSTVPVGTAQRVADRLAGRALVVWNPEFLREGHAVADTLYLTSETDLGIALAHIEQVDPAMLVIDSVQTLASADVEGSAGGVTQVREVAASLIATAKARNMCTLLVGHVTKEGTIAGPRLLEHLVDVVCQFEGDKHSNIRMLRAIKNRYGPTDEVGCFDMHEDGIAPVLDPSGMFVSRTPHPVAGTCVTVTMEGRRPLLAEVQALLDQAVAPAPRRTVAGLDSARIQMLLAVLQRRAGLNVGKLDCYVSTVGGAKISEPAADLACVMALASAAQNKPLPRKLAVFGEVGLAGEVRAVPGIRQRIAEVGRLGFTHVLVPASPTGVGQVPDGVTVREVATLGEALNLLFPQDK